MRRLHYAFTSAALVLACIACGMSSETSAFDGAGRSPGESAADGGGFGGSSGDPTDTARGVVLAHAAVFPTMRLCFGAHPEMKPQPETTTMPQSNVVGIEIGNIARIAPLDETGDIYVIDESRVRPDPAKTCAEWLCLDGGGGVGCALRDGFEYHKIAGPTGPLGQSNVDVLAISGCGNSSFVGSLGASTADCGAPYDGFNGNLAARTIPLVRDGKADAKKIPARVVNLSERLETVRGSNEVSITFGELSGADAPIASNPPLFDLAPPADLTFDQTPAAFAAYGFRATIPNVGEVMKQSLASVQETSAPLDVPSTYFSVASNYALLLLGDPRIRTNDDAGAPNPTYDLRKGLHVIAVPVLDPSTIDAGADANASP